MMSSDDILRVASTAADPHKVYEAMSEIANLPNAEKTRLLEMAEKASAQNSMESPSAVLPTEKASQPVVSVVEAIKPETQDVVVAPLVPAEVKQADEQIAKTVEQAVPEVVAEEQAEEAVIPTDNQPPTAVASRVAFIAEAEKPPDADEAEKIENEFFAS